MDRLKIEYFKRLKKNKKILNSHTYPIESYTPVGCSLEEIEELQIKHKVQFPKAYIEFLYLAGKDHSLFDSGIESEFYILEKIQDFFSSELKESNLETERPIWAITTLHGEQFTFFYLDEESENPIVYYYQNFWEDEPILSNFNDVISSTKKTISQYFDSMVPKKSDVILDKIIFGILTIFWKKHR